ncbi:MAG TPA: chemotaxis protein CheW [Polyangiaceae bacterium]|nr:chemotaxis protein CheW [Polyangiaceae bacterium]
MPAPATESLAERPDGDEHNQYLTFRVRDETFAMGILAIKEIIEFGALTPVPMMPACVRGVINLRGRVVPVIDLAVRFGREPSVPHRRTCVVIVELGSEEERQDLGVLVDGVNQVIEIPAQDIEPAPGFGAKVRPEFIAGMGKLDGDLVIIIDVTRVLSADDLAALMPGTRDGEAA